MKDIHTIWQHVREFLTSGLHVNPLTVARQRAFFCLGGIACLYLFLGSNLAYVTLFSESEDVKIVENFADVQDTRAEIRDRNSEILAKSLRLVSLVADPSSMLDVQSAITATKKIFPDIDTERLQKLLSRKGSRYAMVKRGISPKEQAIINQAGIPGYFFEPSYRRIYPQGNLFSHVVGFTGDENIGLMGLENAFDNYIKGKENAYVRISLDARAQYILHEELSKTIKEYSAIGGSGIIMDAKTREVIAMVSLPDFDPHTPSRIVRDDTFNRATQGLYELGSSLKIINSALSLELGESITGKNYDATLPLAVGGGYEITDYHPQSRPLNIAEIFIHSSNIGSTLMAWEAGGTRQKKLFQDLGLLQKLHTEYPKIATPQFPRNWDDIATSTISFGHGISVTPLQFTNAVATLVGDGINRNPKFTIQNEVTTETLPVVNSHTTLQLRTLMRLNVMEGSGSFANISGYRIGGKTGTAEKINPEGGYDETKIIANFIATFPIDNPQYIVFAMIDEPQQTRHNIRPTGGVVAAPMVGRVIERAAPILGIRPDIEKEKWLDKTLYMPLLQAKEKSVPKQVGRVINTVF